VRESAERPNADITIGILDSNKSMRELDNSARFQSERPKYNTDYSQSAKNQNSAKSGIEY
jgi:hypothetical protein